MIKELNTSIHKMTQAPSPQQAWKTGLDFEKSVLTSFLQTFISTSGEEGKLFGSENGGMFTSLYAEALASNLTGKCGIAEDVVKSLLKNQEGPNTPSLTHLKGTQEVPYVTSL